MKRYLLPKDAGRYKANLHCHTTVSDGGLTPHQIKELYRAAGYSAVAFTDHEVFIGHNDLTDGDFVAINGYEIAVKDGTPAERTGHFMKVHHLGLLAKDPDNSIQVMFYPENCTPGNSANYIPFVKYLGEPCPYEFTAEFVNRLIRTANENGFLVSYNHPAWSLQRYADVAPLEGLFALEVYNSSCFSQGDRDCRLWEELLQDGKRLMPLAGDDFHGQGDPVESFTVIAAPKLDYRNLMQALEKGDAYVSRGPLIGELSYENGLLRVTSPEPVTAILRGEGRYAAVKRNEQDFFFPISWDALGAYLRVELWDAKGRCALTRAYTREELED